jgi:hypothetical protein
MSNFKTANEAYYASKQPLKLSGLKEGRKNPAPHPSYRQISTDTISSSDKYYASSKVAPVKSGFKSAIKSVTLDVVNSSLTNIVGSFMEGASTVTVKGSAAQLSSLRTAVDLAVGRNTLTREQADAVVYILVTEPKVEVQEPVVTQVVVEEPVIEEPETVSEDEQLFLQEADIIESNPEETELLTASTKQRRRRKKEEDLG